MRNFPSALMFIAFAYLSNIGFHWYYLILLIMAFLFWEYPVKENIELVKTQIEESKARTENTRWSTELSKTQVKVNLLVLAKARGT